MPAIGYKYVSSGLTSFYLIFLKHATSLRLSSFRYLQAMASDFSAMNIFIHLSRRNLDTFIDFWW
jgi:hypothetical protein